MPRPAPSGLGERLRAVMGAPPRKVFLAARRDGFGERLRAMINAMILAERFGGEFRFAWGNRARSMASPTPSCPRRRPSRPTSSPPMWSGSRGAGAMRASPGRVASLEAGTRFQRGADPACQAAARASPPDCRRTPPRRLSGASASASGWSRRGARPRSRPSRGRGSDPPASRRRDLRAQPAVRAVRGEGDGLAARLPARRRAVRRGTDAAGLRAGRGALPEARGRARRRLRR